MNEPWTIEEVDLTIDSYFQMLVKELKGIKYKKSEHRKKLAKLIPERTEKAIEYKYQNISAVLAKHDHYFIKGYTPKVNFQKSLEGRTISFLEGQEHIQDVYSQYVNENLRQSLEELDFSSLLDSDVRLVATEPPTTYYVKSKKVNFLEVEKNNIDIGDQGEKIVLEYERWHLRETGKAKLAESVEWVSKTRGDGAGFDILSFDTDGVEKYIEVKTTKMGINTPIFFTRNELEFSKKHASHFRMYRLYDLGTMPRMFIRKGAIDSMCNMVPISYKGYFLE